jgi:uncharacterized protein YaaQ
MKLMIAVIRDIDDTPVLGRLAEKGYRVTRVASTGGFMRKGNVTLIIGMPDEKVDEVIHLFSDTCCPPESGSKRATIFVVDAPHFEQI